VSTTLHFPILAQNNSNQVCSLYFHTTTEKATTLQKVRFLSAYPVQQIRKPIIAISSTAKASTANPA